MATEPRKEDAQQESKKPVRINDLPHTAPAEDEVVKGGLTPRAGGWSTGTDPDALGE